MRTTIAIHGAAGRMGQRLIALAKEDPSLHIVAAIDTASSAHLGRDAGELAGVGPIGVSITGELPLRLTPDCVIDFSAPAGTVQILKTCMDRKLPLVIATTGLEKEHLAEIDHAAHHTAVLLSPSMSLVVNLLFKLTRLAATALHGNGFDVEIVERHHRFKKDAPSGTAAAFADIIQEVMQQERIQHGREGQLSVLLGPHFGALTALVDDVLPAPAKDGISWRRSRLLRDMSTPETGEPS